MKKKSSYCRSKQQSKSIITCLLSLTSKYQMSVLFDSLYYKLSRESLSCFFFYVKTMSALPNFWEWWSGTQIKHLLGFFFIPLQRHAIWNNNCEQDKWYSVNKNKCQRFYFIFVFEQYYYAFTLPFITMAKLPLCPYGSTWKEAGIFSCAWCSPSPNAFGLSNASIIWMYGEPEKDFWLIKNHKRDQKKARD